MKTNDWILLITLSVLWGGSFFFTELVVDAFQPITIVAIRVGLAAAVLLVFCIIGKRRIYQIGRYWRTFIGMGLLNNIIPFILIVWGQTQVSSSLASVLNATTPIFTLIVAHFLSDDEKMNIRKIFGVAIGFGGVVVLISPELTAQLDGTLTGQIAVLGGGLSYAFASVFGRRFGKIGIDPVVTATGQLMASSIILIPIAVAFDSSWDANALNFQTVSAFIGLSVLSTSLAYLLYFKILSSAGSVNIMLVTFLIPVTAIFLGVFVLNEELALYQVWGMLILLFGLLIIDGRLIQQFQKS